MAARLPLIAEINHAIDTLGMYRAELARILCLKCRHVSDSIELEILLEGDLETARKAERFVHFFSLLQKQYSEDAAGMAHWIRKENPVLMTTPLLAMVDEGRLEDVIVELSRKH